MEKCAEELHCKRHSKAWKKYKEYILDKYKDKPFDKEKIYIFI